MHFVYWVLYGLVLVGAGTGVGGTRCIRVRVCVRCFSRVSGVGGGLGRRPPPACVGGRTSPAVAGGHLGGYDVGSESGVLSGEESCYLFTGVTFVFYDASVGRARAAASGRDELG